MGKEASSLTDSSPCVTVSPEGSPPSGTDPQLPTQGMFTSIFPENPFWDQLPTRELSRQEVEEAGFAAASRGVR